MMATSGLVSRIHSCDFSKPWNTRFQYGSSVLPLSIAAPIAGTCDEPIPATILATAHFRFADFDLDFDLAFVFGGTLVLAAEVFLAAEAFLTAVEMSFDGTFLPDRERMPIGRAEFGCKVDIAAKLEHAVVIALEDGVGLLRRQLESLEILRLVGL